MLRYCNKHFNTTRDLNPQIQKIVTKDSMILKKPELPPKHWTKIVRSEWECSVCEYINGHKGKRYDKN